MAKEEIFKQFTAKNLPPEPVTVFGGSYFIRRWGSDDRASWELFVLGGKADKGREAGKGREADPKTYAASVVIRSLVDEAGNQVFADEDLQAVAELETSELNRVLNRCVVLHGLDRDAVEQAEKN